MSRKKRAPKRIPVIDPKFKSAIIPKLINSLMFDGKVLLREDSLIFGGKVFIEGGFLNIWGQGLIEGRFIINIAPWGTKF